MKQETFLDFEIERGKAVITLTDIKKCLDFFPRASPRRIYLMLLLLSLRPAEPMQITWDNFYNQTLVFRPNKQKKRNVLRKIKIPHGIWEELMEYKHNNFFRNKQLFPWTHHSFRRRFNLKYRYLIGGSWALKTGNLRAGKVAEFFKYSMSCFRTTMATLIYYYYSQVYGHGDVALCYTCKFCGHSAEKMTATYYIKRVSDLGLEKYPDVSLLELLDYVLYQNIQIKLTEFKEYTKPLIEYC